MQAYTQTDDASHWRERCAQRLQHLDPDLGPSDARRVAQELWGFERTRAMPPDDAADFVNREMQLDRPRFERRVKPR